ncbi:MAG TPA: FHA domain-containing protein, partial [Planctomycetota bacterium]|nr:FHA domain-containing protein [Planctomycetota bacterium]
ASPDSPEAARFRREVESRERKGEEARARVRAYIERGETVEALSALEEAVRACPRHEEMPELRASVKKKAIEAIERAFGEGDLEGARGALARLRIVAEEGLEMRRLAEALELAEEAARALRRGEFDAALRLAARLQKARPGTAWVDDALRELTSIALALPAIESGPLGRAPRGVKGGQGSLFQPTPRTVAGRSPAGGPAAAPRSRLLLWVDGVGTYLLLDTDRISIGRAGSSARPDIALGADLAGYHAEVLRVDDDYFVVAAQGPVAVGGRPVSRKLLSSGDTLQIGQSCRFTFHLPTALSPTAILSLGQHRIDGDVRKVILLGGHLLLGPGEACHVRTPQKGGVVVLSAAQGRIVCRAEDEVLVDGRPAGREAEVPLGSHVQVGEVTFTITDFVHGR